MCSMTSNCKFYISIVIGTSLKTLDIELKLKAAFRQTIFGHADVNT